MTRNLLVFLLLAALGGSAPAQDDDFKREGNPAQRARKDPLENQPPPAFEVDGWMNTPEGDAVDMASLEGKVVLIDFWGVW